MKPFASLFAMTAFALAASGAAAQAQPVIGLITKTETNPFFVKMPRPGNWGPGCCRPPARPTETTPARSRPWRT